MFTLEKLMPNGATAFFHKTVSFTVHESGTHAVVNSYHHKDMNMISWQDTYVIPLSVQITCLSDVEFLLTYPNAPFAGGVIVDDETATLDSKKARKKSELKLKHNAVEWGGIPTAFGIIDSDPDSQRKISNAVLTAMSLKDSFVIDWRVKDNSLIELNADEMIAIGIEVTQHISLCQKNKNLLDQRINSAINEEELNDIDLQIGWPTDHVED